jgi:hypothetical protein
MTGLLPYVLRKLGKLGTDGKFAPFSKSPIIMNRTGLFKQYEKTFRLSLSFLVLEEEAH